MLKIIPPHSAVENILDMGYVLHQSYNMGTGNQHDTVFKNLALIYDKHFELIHDKNFLCMMKILRR
jgi:hypothetical protein